jgi:mycofactocin precursor
MTTVDNALGEVEVEGEDELDADDVLIEEISIDGMCGVY